MLSHAQTYLISTETGQRPITSQVEANFIREALTQARGNKSQAARLLGITRRALYCRMEKHGIPTDRA